MKTDILGVKVNTETKEQILDLIRNKLDEDKSVFIVTPYSESIVAAQKDQKFRDVLNAADFALPDGAGVLWAARQIGQKIPQRIPGREFIWDLARLASSRGESIFLLGGFGDTAVRVAEKLKAKFPNLKIAGTYNELSFPRKRESSLDSGSEAGMTESAINAINNSSADFLFVALGPLRQEKWIYRNLPNLRVKLAIGVGGTFDYIAGKRPLPPRFLASWGLEWLWRLLTQPWRAWRVSRGVLGLIWYTIRARM